MSLPEHIRAWLTRPWRRWESEAESARETIARYARREFGAEESVYDEDDGWRPIGERIALVGRFALLAELGEGAFGTVHLALDALRLENERLAAVKMPSRAFLVTYSKERRRRTRRTKASAEEDELVESARLEIGQRFSQEAAQTARLAACPQVVSILEHDITVPYLALEFCDGGSLEDRIAAGGYSWEDVLRWSIGVAQALEAGHGLRPDPLVHRDLKPANVLLHGGEVKLSDYGAARTLIDANTLETVSRSGFTPVYAAPEAWDGIIKPATDVWSLAVMVYELVAGRPPFVGKSIFRLTQAIASEPPAPFGEDLQVRPPAGLEALLASALAKEADDRPSAAEMRAALEALGAEGAPASPAAEPTPSGRIVIRSRPRETQAEPHRRRSSGRRIRISGLTPPEASGSDGARQRLVIRRPASILDELGGWLRASSDERAAAAREAAARLGPDFQPRGLKRFGAGELASFLHRSTGLAFILIPGGSATLGTRDVEAEIAALRGMRMRLSEESVRSEGPERRVELAPFLIGRAPVRQREWALASRSQERAPVTGQSWDAVRRWLSAHGLRLPSESEWEYACRAGSTERYFWGAAPGEGEGDISLLSRNAITHLSGVTEAPPVRLEQRNNGFGLTEMLGLVWEWCEDSWTADPSQLPSDGGALVRPGRDKAIRGGSLRASPAFARCAARVSEHASAQRPDLGFRAALSLPLSSPRAKGLS